MPLSYRITHQRNCVAVTARTNPHIDDSYLQSVRKFLVVKGHRSVWRSTEMSPTLVTISTDISEALSLSPREPNLPRDGALGGKRGACGNRELGGGGARRGSTWPSNGWSEGRRRRDAPGPKPNQNPFHDGPVAQSRQSPKRRRVGPGFSPASSSTWPHVCPWVQSDQRNLILYSLLLIFSYFAFTKLTIRI